MVGKDGDGAGICRHRSLLLKYLLDRLKVADCSVACGVMTMPGTFNVATKPEDTPAVQEVVRPGDAGASASGVVEDHMWNVVRIGGRPYLVDCMLAPGTLMDEDGRVLGEPGCVLAQGGPVKHYHRIGGRSGIRSMGDETLGQLDFETLSVGRTRRSLSVLEKATTYEGWVELLKASVEAHGGDGIEVCRGDKLSFGDFRKVCSGCSSSLDDGMCAHLRRCGHAFHLGCLKQAWASGTCPECDSPFGSQEPRRAGMHLPNTIEEGDEADAAAVQSRRR